MKKQVVIHTGPGKTGTSAIQYWLNSNRAFLKNNGVLYPKHAQDINNISSGNLLTIFDRDMDGNLDLNKSKLDTLMQKFIKSDCQILLLSSEFFFSVLPSLYKALPEAKFLAYLRNPLDVFESNYNQGVKRSKTIKELHLPLNLKFYVIEDIIKIFNELKNINLCIRPYAKELFVKGNIVNDLLLSIGLDIPTVKHDVINSSYNLQALEFKRLTNNFTDSNVDKQLDFILQSYNCGDSNYSLVKASAYEKVKERLVETLEVFIKDYKQPQLLSFIQLIKGGVQKKIVQHQVTATEIKQICEFVKDANPDVFNQLAMQIQEKSHILISNQEFYKCFDIEPVFDVDPSKNTKILTLANKMLSEKVKRRVDVCREMALFLESIGDKQLALDFLQTAYGLDPSRNFIRNKINELNNEVFIQERVELNTDTKKSRFNINRLFSKK